VPYGAGGVGLNVSGTDFVPAALDSGIYDVGDEQETGDNNGATIVLEIPGALIKQWIDGDNPGLLLRSDAEGEFPHLGQIASSEHKKIAWRPKLQITYTPAD